MKKKIRILLCAFGTLLVIAVALLMLNRFEYMANFNSIDNIVGMLPVALLLFVTVGIAFLLWVKYKQQNVAIICGVAFITILSAALFPNALRGNWWINPSAPSDVQTAPDLTVYAPFSPDSQTAKLEEPALLKLEESLPILDGATALYPVYAAFAEAVYKESAFSEDMVLCTNTNGAYQAMIAGERDIIFVASASETQKTAAKQQGVDLVFTPIGREAFVFLTGKDNPVDNITYQQLRNIYSGKTAYWHTLGWKEGGKILAFQRPEGSGSQTGLQSIVMKNLPIQVPQPLPDPSLTGTNSLMKQASVTWKGVQPALGYSYKYYATTMYPNEDTKLLSIDGVYPSVENIQNGTYPFIGDFYAVTKGQPTGNTKLLIDFILSPQGQELIEKTGYSPIEKS